MFLRMDSAGAGHTPASRLPADLELNAIRTPSTTMRKSPVNTSEQPVLDPTVRSIGTRLDTSRGATASRTRNGCRFTASFSFARVAAVLDAQMKVPRPARRTIAPLSVEQAALMKRRHDLPVSSLRAAFLEFSF